MYIKALEDEVLRLKEVYSNVSQDKTQLEEENKLLKGLLSQHGLAPPDLPHHQEPPSGPDSTYGPNSNMTSDSYQYQDSAGSSSAFSPGLASQASGPSVSSTARPPAPPGGEWLQQTTQQTLGDNGVDYEQAGIDFVLTYDEPKAP